MLLVCIIIVLTSLYMHIKAIRIEWEKPISEQKFYRQLKFFESNATENGNRGSCRCFSSNEKQKLRNKLCWNVEMMCKRDASRMNEIGKLTIWNANSKWSTKKRRLSNGWWLKADGLSDDIIFQIFIVVVVVVGVSLKKKSKKVEFVDKRPVEMNWATIKMNK